PSGKASGSKGGGGGGGGSGRRWRKLQWRPPGMGRAPSPGNAPTTSPSAPSSPREDASKGGGAAVRPRRRPPRRPPSNPAVLKSPPPNLPPRGAGVSSGASVTTFKSNASSTFTTKSSSTQPRSNRTHKGKGGGKRGAKGGAYAGTGADGSNRSTASMTSRTPPLARYRRWQSAKDASRADGLSKSDAFDEGERGGASHPEGPPPLPPPRIDCDAADPMETSSLTDDEEGPLRPADDRGANDRRESVGPNYDVTFEHVKIHVTKHRDDEDPSSSPCVTPSRAARTSCNVAPSFDEAQHMIDNTCVAGTKIVVGLGKRGASKCATAAGSPTSVMGFPVECGSTSVPFDECSWADELAEVDVPVRNPARFPSPDGKRPAHTPTVAAPVRSIPALDRDADDDGDDRSSVATDDRPRRPGPVDVDTCEWRPTPDELRHLRAMRRLGLAHLANGERNAAIDVYAEILRGQRERHGGRSARAARAMRDLGAICLRAERHELAVRLCDGAARIHAERRGKGSTEVARSLEVQGRALMELEEHGLAGASFREALRIRRSRRRRGSGDDGEGSGEGAGQEGEDEGDERDRRASVARLLNHVGCALSETDELEEARDAFEEALSMQRDLMRASSSGQASSGSDVDGEGGDDDEDEGGGEEREDDDDILDEDPRGAHRAPLGIALTLTNLGSIHLRLGAIEESLACFEEAALIQESVLGEDHEVVATTQESIDFATRSTVERVEDSDVPRGGGGGGVRIARIAGVLPYVSYEESKRLCGRVQDEISAVVDVVNSARCDRPFSCPEGMGGEEAEDRSTRARG
ncbi:hypothetical protein ACHAWF_010867, partial [Thalassiosira exigua]